MKTMRIRYNQNYRKNMYRKVTGNARRIITNVIDNDFNKESVDVYALIDTCFQIRYFNTLKNIVR